ncbi:MAG: c-type cytochrome [Bacteroidia bacterium]|nr:c-type cytochrome [Bacteroidia bacterium]
MKLLSAGALFMALCMASCGSENAGQGGNTQPAATQAVSGKTIFGEKCVACHGNDGKAAIGGAVDLSTSTLDKAGAAAIIANGRKAMRAYKDELTPAEIDSLAEYLQTLKK